MQIQKYRWDLWFYVIMPLCLFHFDFTKTWVKTWSASVSVFGWLQKVFHNHSNSLDGGKCSHWRFFATIQLYIVNICFDTDHKNFRIYTKTQFDLPRPQVALQGVHSVHWDTTQSTGHGMEQSSSASPASGPSASAHRWSGTAWRAPSRTHRL